MSASTMSLGDYAVKTRTKNTDLKKKILLYKQEIPLIENEILTLTTTYDELNENCKRLHVLINENETNCKSLLLESQRQFQEYIKDIQTYIETQHHKYNLDANHKCETVPPVLNLNITNTVQLSSNNQHQPVTLSPSMNNQLVSVENWLVDPSKSHSSAHNGQELVILSTNKNQDELEIFEDNVGDGEDDLYKDLVLGGCEEGELNDNNNENEEHTIEDISSSVTTEKTSQSYDAKPLRRYALMRHLAEKSVKKSKHQPESL
ncbi:unnamed protein product [Didymodactylos carnosus]|uniref:Uncharacterized protein n=1 Tax=Didymodactylos carnosus TaxID=1234261 RepID=A0A814AA83_9BILA|nr:unnamed protein product [Didymodactylos carnosus]CAF3691142.1 unnamed protein product [Didymodactylos carnosus]